MTDLLERIEDGIAWLTLNRPDRLNAFSPAMLQALGKELERLGGNGEVGAVIVTDLVPPPSSIPFTLFDPVRGYPSPEKRKRRRNSAEKR